MIDLRLSAKFKSKLKRLAKKFRNLPNEINLMLDELEADPKKGTDLGGGFHKIRLASKNKVGGKSGGFRVITYYVEQKNDSQFIYLVTIYDKSEEDSIDKKELLKILENELG